MIKTVQDAGIGTEELMAKFLPVSNCKGGSNATDSDSKFENIPLLKPTRNLKHQSSMNSSNVKSTKLFQNLQNSSKKSSKDGEKRSSQDIRGFFDKKQD